VRYPKVFSDNNAKSLVFLASIVASLPLGTAGMEGPVLTAARIGPSGRSSIWGI
jgi:hypothetical protein